MQEKKTSPLTKLPKFTYVFLGMLLVSIIVYIIAVISPAFADLYNDNIGATVRAILAWITSPFPFSLAEIFIMSIPFIIGLIAFLAYKKYCPTLRSSIIFTVSVLSCISLFFSVFVLGFGTGYHGSPLDQKLSLNKKAVSPAELEATGLWIAERVNESMTSIAYGDDDFSVMPYSIDDMNTKLLEAYDKVVEKYPFIQSLYSRVKPVMFSKVMSYAHITGVYTYFTGEANINVDFPDYTIPFTAAHELAHQRGIAREDEANFVAFLVCIESDDSYIRYSGYLNMYEYLALALSQSPEAYQRVRSTLDNTVIDELRAYSKFFDQYRHSTMGKVSEKVNDTYLQAQGTVGTKSYGMVVDLTVAFYLSERG